MAWSRISRPSKEGVGQLGCPPPPMMVAYPYNPTPARAKITTTIAMSTPYTTLAGTWHWAPLGLCQRGRSATYAVPRIELFHRGEPTSSIEVRSYDLGLQPTPYERRKQPCSQALDTWIFRAFNSVKLDILKVGIIFRRTQITHRR